MNTVLPLDIELGILAGFAVATAGYLKSYTKVDEKGNREKFDLDRFAKTVIMGAVLGGGLSYLSLMDDAIMMFLSTAGLTVIIDDLVKIFMRVSDAPKKK